MSLDISSSLITDIGAEHHGNHPPDDDEWFQESALFNFCDPRRGVGGEYRIGAHPNHGTGHLYTWTQLGGRMLDKRFVEDLDVPAGDVNSGELHGLTITAEVPFERYRLQLQKDNLRVDLVWEAFHPPIVLSFNVAGATVANGHYNALGRATGSITFDGETTQVSGDGFMDHSWGTRHKHLPGSRWIIAVFDPETFVMALPLLSERGRAMAGYLAYDGRLTKLDHDFDVNMTMRDDWITPAACDARLFDELGRGIAVRGTTKGPSSIHPFTGGKMYCHALAEFEMGGRLGRGLLESSAPSAMYSTLLDEYQLKPDGIWAPGPDQV